METLPGALQWPKITRAKVLGFLRIFKGASLKSSIEVLMEQAAQKDTGFDPYWFAIALNRSEKFPDELERWPVKMLKSIDPKDLKASFQKLALELLDKSKPAGE